jgi:hypothetical protein
VQVKSLGALQPLGSVVFESASPDIGRPSADVNATVSVWLVPEVTETVPPTDGVAITESAEVAAATTPDTKPGLLLAPALWLEAPESELLRTDDPVLVLVGPSKLQPVNSDSVQRPASRARWMVGIYLDSLQFEEFPGATEEEVTR